jgi:hypothetical protein
MEAQRAPSISRIATKYGLIQGVLSFLVFLGPTLAHVEPSWVGTAITTVLLIVLMVLAHREFKRTHDGMMTYSQGLGSGTLLATVAAVVSAVLMFIYVKFFNTAYIPHLLEIQRAALQERGIKGAQLDQAMWFTSIVMTPVGIVISALISGVIYGFIVALIVSIFTQKRDPRAVV